MEYDFALAMAARPNTVKRTNMLLIIDATSPFLSATGSRQAAHSAGTRIAYEPQLPTDPREPIASFLFHDTDETRKRAVQYGDLTVSWMCFAESGIAQCPVVGRDVN